MTDITLPNFYAAGGKFRGDFTPVPSGAIWPTNNVLPQIFPMRKMTAIEDDNTPAEAYHRNSLPGVPWAYPHLVMLGSGPRLWVLRQGAPGMVIRNGTFDENGKWTLGDAGVLEWDNPVSGTYEIIVDVFDQIGQITWRYTHVCGDVSKHIIVSTSGAGTGDGSSAANAMSWANAYLGDTTLSPTQGKVLHLLGGDYTAALYQIFPQYHSRNIVHYGADDPANGSPKFQCRFNDQGGHRVIAGIEFNDMDWPSNGIIQTGVNADYFLSWRNRFINIRNSTDGSSDNESCHTSMGTGGAYFRKGYVAYQNYYEDVGIAFTDMFSLEEFVNGNEEAVHLNPAYTTRGVNPGWYAKSGCKFIEISHNRFDNPTVSAGSGGIVHIQNAATQGGYARGFAEYNFIRCNGGNAIRSNSASNGLPIDAINWIRRNDVIGGDITTNNYDSGVGGNRFTHFIANAIQNSDSATDGIDQNSGGYDVAQHECVGASGVFDSEGNLIGAFIEYLYTRGSIQGIAT